MPLLVKAGQNVLKNLPKIANFCGYLDTVIYSGNDPVNKLTDRFIVARLTLEGDKFEIIVKPDPALEYKLGKRPDLSGALVSDDIYSDAQKGSRASTEKM